MVSEEEIEAAIRKMIMEKNGDDLNAALEEFTEDKTDTEIHFAAEKFLELYHLGIQHKEDERRRKEDDEKRTNQAAKRSGKKFSGGKSRLHVEKYTPLSKDWWNDELKELITEGGAYGHMAHPFDDKDLTFKDLKNIIEMGLGGQLDREDNVTEKLDGQNLMISWRG